MLVSLRLAPLLLVLLGVAVRPVILGAETVFKFTDAKGAPAADVVISLERLDGPTPAPAASPPSTAEVTQQNETFIPQVTVLRTGSSVAFTNKERKIRHQIYSRSEVRTFEIPLHEPGKSTSVVFDRPGVVALGCSIHDHMSAFIYVFDTPWFTKSDPHGDAKLADVPAGRYRATVQHPRLDTPEVRELTLPAATAPVFTLALRPPPRTRRVLDAGGGSYK